MSQGRHIKKDRSAPAAGRPVSNLGALDDRLGYFVRRLQVWIFQDFIRRLSPIDINPAQFSVLVIVNANSGLSQAQLSNALDIERARLVRVLHRLEERGLVRRLPSSTDGRRHALQLTKRGQTILARAEILALEHEAALRQKLGRQRHQSILEALRELYRPRSASLDDGLQPSLAKKLQSLTCKSDHMYDG